MGANTSLMASPEPPDWQAYLKEPWRSRKSRDLDKQGGLARESIARGNSFNTLLQKLGDGVLEQAADINDSLFPERRSLGSRDSLVSQSSITRQHLEHQRPASSSSRPLRLSTSGSLRSSGTSWGLGAAGEAEKRNQMEARKRMMEYGQMLSDVHSVRSSRDGAPVNTTRLSAPRTSLTAANPPTSASGPLTKHASGGKGPAASVPAQWRRRVHAARRRLMLIIKVIVRLKMGLPGRLRRVDSFSIYVGKALGDTAQRFAEEHRRSQNLHLEMEACKLIMTSELHGSRAASRRSTADPSTTHPGPGLTHQDPSLTHTRLMHTASEDRSPFQLGAMQPTLEEEEEQHQQQQPTNHQTAANHQPPSSPGSQLTPAPVRGPTTSTPDLRPVMRLGMSVSGPLQGPHGATRSRPGTASSVGAASVRTITPAAPQDQSWASIEASAEAMGTMLAAMDSVPAARIPTWLNEQFATRAQLAHQSSLMMKMHVSRANSRVAETTQPWRAPSLWGPERSIQQFGEVAYQRAVEEVCHLLVEGQVAVMVLCGEENLELSDGRHVDFWAVDPWQLVQACRPGCMPPTERVEGVPLGARVVLQVLSSVTQLAGPQAAQRLTLLLSCSDRQQGEVMGEVLGRSFYGLPPENVIILPQPTWPGHRYQADRQLWRRDPLGAPHSLGSGYAAMLLSWVGDARTISSQGELLPLNASVIETLEARGVKWLVAERLRDLSLLSASGALDAHGLAQLLLLHRHAGANMGVWCGTSTNSVASRQLGLGLVVEAGGVVRKSHVTSKQPAPPVNTAAPSPRKGRNLHAGAAKGDTALTSPTRTSGSTAKDAPAAAPPPARVVVTGFSPVIEVKHGECGSPALVNAITQCRETAGGAETVSLQRYAFHVPSLINLLTGFPFHARLSLMGPPPVTTLGHPSASESSGLPQQGGTELVAVTWDIVDLMQVPEAVCAPLHASDDKMVQLCSVEDVPSLVGPLQSQDHDPAFRKILSQHQNVRHAAEVIGSADNSSGNCVVVLIPSITPLTDTAVALASLLARPGRDTLHLVTVVSTALAVREGEKLLSHYHSALLPTMIATRQEVLVRHPWTLLDVVEWYVTREKATLLVMGSGSMTDAPAPSSIVVSSLTLAAIRRLLVPVLVVTANTKPLARAATAGAQAVTDSTSLHSTSIAARQQQAASASEAKPHTTAADPTPAQAAVTAAMDVGGCRALVLAEGGGSKAMLRWLCAGLDAGRGDTLVLSQVLQELPKAMAGKYNAQQQMKKHEDEKGYLPIASAVRVPVAKRLCLFGALEKVLPKAAASEGVNLLAVQLPPGRMPLSLLHLIRSSPAGVLIYKSAGGGLGAPS